MSGPWRAVTVDDEPPALRRLRGLMSANGGIEVVGEFTDPAAAREGIAALQPDVAFLDIQMPGMTGLELLASIKRSEPDLPVIVVTSAIDAQTRQKAMDGGARAFLVKPIRDAELLSHLANILS